MVNTPQSEVHMDTPKWVHLFQESALALDKTSTRDSRTKNHRVGTTQRQTSDDRKKDSSFHRNHSGMSCPECGSVLTSQTLSRLPALQSLQDRDASGSFQENSMPRDHWLSQRLQADTQSSRRGDRSVRGLLLRNHWDSGRGSQWSVYAPGKRDHWNRLSRCRSCGYSSSSGDTAFLSQDLWYPKLD